MGYSAADERFTHQWPRPFDEVHHPDGSWSDRCYFFVHSPDGELLVTNGYGNNPNQLAALEGRAMSVDQLMRFDHDGDVGLGMFEILSGSDGYARYPSWPPMDMSKFRQRAVATGPAEHSEK
jgi:hypothetical protein